MSPYRRPATRSRPPAGGRRIRGLGPLPKEGRIYAANVRIPGPDASGRSGVDTNASTSAALMPCGTRALRFAAVGTSPTARHRKWCRGDLTSVTPSKERRCGQRCTACDPRAENRAWSLRNTLPWLLKARRCRRAVALSEAPCGSSSRYPSTEADRRGRRTFRTPVAANDGRGPRWHEALTGTAPRAWLTRSGAHSRETHEESSRPHRRAHLFGGPATTGCQRLAHGEQRRLSSRHSRGPSTCPQERVFRSFP